LLAHGDLYKVAVADCACHDNRMDKIWRNELWMGWAGLWADFAKSRTQHDQPQQGESVEQGQDASLRPNARTITAVAQPTPALTERAPSAQFRAQAPHSMQASRSTIRALPFCKAKTACGQTVRHMPQPVHFW
jgi:hypothetical protein